MPEAVDLRSRFLAGARISSMDTRMEQSSGDPNGSGDRAYVGPVPTILAPLKPLEDVLATIPGGREGP